MRKWNIKFKIRSPPLKIKQNKKKLLFGSVTASVKIWNTKPRWHRSQCKLVMILVTNQSMVTNKKQKNIITPVIKQE